MSASNNKFELAVAVPIVNNSFKYPNRYVATATTITATAITLSNIQWESSANTMYLSEVAVDGDRITLKATGGTVGTTTWVDVSKADSSGITADNMALQGFDANTIILGYGNSIPGGWYSSYYLPASNYAFVRDIGNVDNFCIGMTLPTASATSTNFYLKQSINTDYYVQNLSYRLGCVSKITVTGVQANTASVMLGMEMTPTETDNVTLYNSSASNVASFTSTSGTVTLTTASATAFGIYIWMNTDVAQVTKETTVYVDDVYLEHVYNPVTKKTIYGETAIGSSADTCFYEISENHDSESLSITTIDNFTDVNLNDASIARFDSTGWGERNIKYEVSCKFTNVLTSIWTYLNKLLDIQKNGYKLNLHPYVAELPEVLTGFLYLTSVSKEHWDAGLVSFDFRFRES
jgi:hypothetical protein